jgi:hypothetical protein
MTINSVGEGVLVVIGTIIFAFLLAGLTGVFVMLLWNWLMPSIFHLREINFWEAWGLAWLCGILFKSSTSSSKS